MNRRPITYNYLITIANGSIHFHAFSYQYPGSGYGQQPVISLIIGRCLTLYAYVLSPPSGPPHIARFRKTQFFDDQIHRKTQ